MSGEDIKEEIRRRIDIVELVSHYVPLQRAGTRFRARCPFHVEKTPSFYVDPDRGHWKCFGCGASGDIFSFIMQMEGLTFPEAGERLAQQAGLEWHTTAAGAKAGRERQTIAQANSAALEFYSNLLWSPQGQVARDYLAKRGVSDELIRTYQLGYAPEGWDNLLRHLAGKGFGEQLLLQGALVKVGQRGGHYDVFRHRIIFPIIDVTGRVVGFGGRALDPDEQAKYLNSPDSPLFKKGQTVYGLNLARQAIVEAGQALVVEGYMDVIALAQAGFGQAVACLGTATTEAHLKLLSRYTDRVVFVYDADAAGMKAALRNVGVFETSSADVKVATLPAGQDPDDCVRTGGPAVFQRCVDESVSFVEYQIRMMFSQRDQDSADDRLRAAREAVTVLAKVTDRTRQEEYLARTASWWAYGDPGRAENLARLLRVELQRLRADAPGRRTTVRRRTDDRNVILQTVARAAGPVEPRILALEEVLLTAMLNHDWAVRQVAQKISGQDFHDPLHRQIAEALLEQAGEPAFEPADVLYSLSEEGGLRERAVDLQLRPEVPDEEEIAGHLEKVLYYRAARGMRPMTEMELEVTTAQSEEESEEDFEALRRRVVQAIAEGSIAYDHPDFMRFQRLSRRYRGKGQQGFSDSAGLTPLGPNPPPKKIEPDTASQSGPDVPPAGPADTP